MFLANNDNLFFESFCMLKCVVWDGFLEDKFIIVFFSLKNVRNILQNNVIKLSNMSNRNIKQQDLRRQTVKY